MVNPMPNEPELLDIRQAAALLQVSETSLRRWTNAGRLACLRVGGRRERRFRRADLLAFLERNPGAVPPAPPQVTGAEATDLSTGHLCGLYTSDLTRTRQAAQFLAEGLHAGSACFLAAEPDVRDRVRAQLERQRPSLRHDIAEGRLVFSDYADSAAAQLEYWETRFVAATRVGAHSLRVVGDVSGGKLGRGAAFEEVLEYEAEYGRSLVPRFPVATLCLYDARGLSGVEAARLLQVHADGFRYSAERSLAKQ
jgi:excisionase family DNA binding protein